MKYLSLILAVNLFVLSSCNKDDELIEDLPNSDSTEVVEEVKAAFESRVHPTSGDAIVKMIDGNRFLVLENFKTDNGPALKVYFSSAESPSDYIDLGDLKAVEGTFNYELPDNLDIEKTPYILIWCERFSVLFGLAKLPS